MEGQLARMDTDLAERPDQVVARISEARALVVRIQKELMKPGVHYGVIPGTAKPALLKEGAEILNQAFRLAAREDSIEDLSGTDERKYKTVLGLYDQLGRRLGFGVGVCSTSEEKYHWRKAYKNEYDAAPVDRRRTKEYKRKEGEGMDVTYQVRTEPADMENTVLQMSVKRALVQATRQVHAVSDIFADITLEDLPAEVRDSLMLGGKPKIKRPEAKSKAETPKPAPAAPPAATTPAATAAAEEREPGGDDESSGEGIIPAPEWEAVRAAWHDRGTISAAQSKRIFGVAFGAGWKGPQIVDEIRRGLGIDQDAEGVYAIPFGKPYDTLVALFGKGPDKWGE